MTYEPVITAYAQVLLLIVFGTAGWSKLRSLEAFEGVVYNFRILPESIAGLFSRLLPVVEIAVAAGLVLPMTRAGAAAAALALLAMFCVAIAVNLARGRREIDCGCFSSTLKQHLGGGLILRNIVLAGLAGLLVWQPVTSSQMQPALWLVGAAAALLTVFIYTSATYLKRYQLQGVTGRRQAAGEG